MRTAHTPIGAVTLAHSYTGAPLGRRAGRARAPDAFGWRVFALARSCVCVCVTGGAPAGERSQRTTNSATSERCQLASVRPFVWARARTPAPVCPSDCPTSLPRTGARADTLAGAGWTSSNCVCVRVRVCAIRAGAGPLRRATRIEPESAARQSQREREARMIFHVTTIAQRRHSRHSGGQI